DFRADDAGLNEDQRNLAGYLQDAWMLEPTEDLYDAAVLFDQLVNVQTLEQYRKALDTLASDAGQGPAAYIPLSNRSFFTRLMSCPQFYREDAAMREGDCAWGRFLGNHTRRDTTSETGGFTVDSQTYQIGGQKEVAPGWFLGGSLAYESSRHRVSDLPVRTEGDGFQAGVVLKRQAGAWPFAGSLTTGHGPYRTRRGLVLPDEALDARSRWRTHRGRRFSGRRGAQAPGEPLAGRRLPDRRARHRQNPPRHRPDGRSLRGPQPVAHAACIGGAARLLRPCPAVLVSQAHAGRLA